MQLNLSSLRESVADQILAVAWFSTSVDQKPLLNFTEIYMEFKELGFDRTHFNDAFSELITKEPKQLIQHALNVYKLSPWTRAELDQKYARFTERPQTVEAKQLLTDLLSYVVDRHETNYLKETLICFDSRAYRASIIMAWILAFDHLCRYLFADPARLAAFNSVAVKKVTTREDFYGLKEVQILQSCRAAGIIEKNALQVLEHALTRRNMAAHACDVPAESSTAESIIIDLVRYFIAKYPLP